MSDECDCDKCQGDDGPPFDVARVGGGPPGAVADNPWTPPTDEQLAAAARNSREPGIIVNRPVLDMDKVRQEAREHELRVIALAHAMDNRAKQGDSHASEIIREAEAFYGFLKGRP